MWGTKALRQEHRDRAKQIHTMLSRLKSDRTLLLFIFFLKVILLLKLIASRITSKVYATEQKNPKN